MAATEQTMEPETKLDELYVNYGGDEKHFVYKAHELVQQLISTAIQRFHITAQPHQLSLFLAGTPLDPSKTLGDAGVKPGAHLVLQQTVVQGG